MARSKRRDDDRFKTVRRAFWDSDSPAEPLPDSQEARAAEVAQELGDQILAAVHERLRERKVTQQELASKMGVSEGRISQILSGGQNLTMKTVGALIAAVEAKVVISLLDRDPVAGPTRRLV